MYSTKSHHFDKSMSNEIDHLPCLLTLADFGWVQFSSKNFLKYCKRDTSLENDIIELLIPVVKDSLQAQHVTIDALNYFCHWH